LESKARMNSVTAFGNLMVSGGRSLDRPRWSRVSVTRMPVTVGSHPTITWKYRATAHLYGLLGVPLTFRSARAEATVSASAPKDCPNWRTARRSSRRVLSVPSVAVMARLHLECPVAAAIYPGRAAGNGLESKSSSPSSWAKSSRITHDGAGRSTDWAYSNKEITRRIPRRARRMRYAQSMSAPSARRTRSSSRERAPPQAWIADTPFRSMCTGGSAVSLVMFDAAPDRGRY
jgi:hypothetical protein